MLTGCHTIPIPITTPFAILTPHKQVVLEYKSNAVMYQIDTREYWNALANLANIHHNLTDKVHELGIIESDWPQLQAMANHTHFIIEALAEKLLNTLETLPHPRECPVARQKRDVEVVSTKRGLFRGLGTALSWLTGNLDAGAGDYINTNYNNILKLKDSQGKMIKVLNNTSHKAHENSEKIVSIQNSLESLKLDLKGNSDKSDMLDKLIITYDDYELSIAQLGDKISELVQLTQAAVKGNVDQVALKGQLWPQIVESLDPQTRSLPNLKYYVAKTTIVQVQGCVTFIDIVYNIPLISSDIMWLYRVRNIPVFRKDHYQIISNEAHYVSWDHNMVWLYAENEIANCKNLGYLLVCKKARNVEKLRDSCLYSLAKTLTPKCNYTMSQEEDIQINFEDNYLVYFIPPGQVKLSNLFCDNKEKQARELVKSGAIFVPEGCEVHIDHLTYAPLITKPHTTIQMKPRLFKPNMEILSIHPTLPAPIIVTKETSMEDEEFLKDQSVLLAADTILGEVKISPDHVIWAGVSFSVVLGIVLILVIALFVLYCKVTSFTQATKILRPRPHKDSD